jgi:hypothetical protein
MTGMGGLVFLRFTTASDEWKAEEWESQTE